MELFMLDFAVIPVESVVEEVLNGRRLEPASASNETSEKTS
jgi:hypothetical protein